MKKLFRLQLEIRYADWPFILQGFITFFILSIGGYFLLNSGLYVYFLLIISLLFLIFTAVHFYNIQKEHLESYQYKIQALNELTKLLPIRAPLPAMTGWAATPELAINVYKTIQIHKPQLVVETGSGVSTVVAGYAIEKFCPGGKIISFDHNPDFANRTRIELKQHQLKDYAEVRTAPLTELAFNGKKWKCYDIDFDAIQIPIDLLIIDGPPLKTQKNARFPILPAFYSKLSEQAVLILHDTDRNAEAETVRMWLQNYPEFEHTYLHTKKGISIFKRKPNH